MFAVRPELVEPALSDVQTESQCELRLRLAEVVAGQAAVRPLTGAPPPPLHQQDLQLPGGPGVTTSHTAPPLPPPHLQSPGTPPALSSVSLSHRVSSWLEDRRG